MKNVQIRSSSSPYLPAIGLNMERYFVSLLIQSECRKIQTRKKIRFWTLFTQWSFLDICSNYKSIQLFLSSFDIRWQIKKGFQVSKFTKWLCKYTSHRNISKVTGFDCSKIFCVWYTNLSSQFLINI